MSTSDVTETQAMELPLLPLRDVVVYPHMVIPLFVGRQKSIAALQYAMDNDKKILLVAQKNAKDDEPNKSDLYSVGTLATVLQLLRLPDGTVKVLVEGIDRISLSSIEEDEFLTGRAELIDTHPLNEREQESLVRILMAQFDKYVQLSKKVPSEVITSLNSIEDPGRLADTIASHLSLKVEEKQNVLEVAAERERIEHLLSLLESEIDLLEVEKRIRGRVKKQMEKSQREYYLNEQIKAIQKELGDLDENNANEVEDLTRKIDESGMPKDAKDKALSELNKLKMMSPMSAEASVVRNYLDWMLGVPWSKRSRVRHDLAKAKDVLETDHYGLDEVKERILEYLAVQQRVKKVKGPVLCLVGPPGVGKTSLGQSIAKATNRKFVRMALGGVRDESEIRGHRRTYIGSMPGKIVQKLSKAGVKNPLFLLDEIDKMGMDHRGDPASALLEVLDPEQNHTFNDHYLEVDYDLSDVMFVCTSNSMNIPGPLLDRMEVIRIPGYTEDEKLNIAQRYLIPKQVSANGLKADEVKFEDDAILSLIRHYTREAGVRGLEREVAKVCRKVVMENVLSKSTEASVISEADIEKYSGVQKFKYGIADKENQIGMVTGLAWTSVGGELLNLEASCVSGKGAVMRTGSLGDVMKESIQAALTVVRSRAQGLGILPNFHETKDIHIHVPEGATPKDGPSAGIGMCTALVSVLSRIPVRADVAMTGEIALRGQVLPIGGLKEKLLAAHRGGIKTVIIPEENVRDLKEIPDNIKSELEIKSVSWIDEVLDIALENKPKALTDEEVAVAIAKQKAKPSDDNSLSTH
jgi:ATP-dependent Lon protease